MCKIVPFPGHHRLLAAQTIPREEFEHLAGLALDMVDRIVAILDAQGETAAQESGDALAATGMDLKGHTSPVIWLHRHEGEGAE